MLAVRWSNSIDAASLGHCKFEMQDSSKHPWPPYMRAPLRALRRNNPHLHLAGWIVDDELSIIAIGLGKNKKQKVQAMRLAYNLCRSGSENGVANILKIEPTDYPADDEAPKGSTRLLNNDRRTLYAVAFCTYYSAMASSSTVCGHFFDSCSNARTYFEQIKYGEWPAVLLGPDGREIDSWHCCYNNKLSCAVEEWWCKRTAACPAAPQVPASQTSRPNFRAHKDDGVGLDADAEGIEMVEAIRASFNGVTDTVDSVFEKLRGSLHLRGEVKDEEVIIKVPVSELRFTQKACSSHFQCACWCPSNWCRSCPTRSLEDTIQVGFSEECNAGSRVLGAYRIVSSL